MKRNLRVNNKDKELFQMDSDKEDPGRELPLARVAVNNNNSLIKKIQYNLTKFLQFGSQESSLEEDVADLIEEHDPEGTQVGTEERSILHNVLRLSDVSVSDVMVPRVDIVAADIKLSLDNLKNVIKEKEHTRIPVYKDSLDNIIGFIHIKDLMPYLGQSAPKDFSLENILREILFVPPSMKVVDLLLKMKAKRVHIALVLDEYGGTDGLVTLEDLVEEIVGEINDEHDEEEFSQIKNIGDASFEVSARIPLDELEGKLKIQLLDEDSGENIDTLGGLVVYMLGHVPIKGEIARHRSGLEFEVIEADARKISKLLVKKSLQNHPSI